MRIEDSNYLVHYGIFGQKWGIRRFQNSDGTLTAEGKSRYRTDKVLNNVGRAFTNSSLGQRMDVNLNKGYRTDKKEIKGIYKEKKKALKEAGADKQEKKQLKSDYKKTLGEARTAAAQANYNWQSDKTNEKIQTQKVGKTFLKSLLTGGGGGAMVYDNLSANDVHRGASYLAGLGWGSVDYLTGGGASLAAYIGGKTGAIKSPNASVKNENKQSSTPKQDSPKKVSNDITNKTLKGASNKEMEAYMKKRNSFKTDEEKDRWERQQELDRIKKSR